jgi:two-component sensor histidine kinase
MATLALALTAVVLPRRLTSAQMEAYGAAALCAVLMLVGGRWFYLLQRDSLRLDAEAQLDAIARLKVAQVADWRRERLADAVLVRGTPYAARRALDAIASPQVSTTRYMFTSWLKPLLAKGPYRQALVLDADLTIRLAYPESATVVLDAAEREAGALALRTREVAVADLHRHGEDGAVHLSFLVPLVARREGDRESVPAAGRETATDRGAGVLVLQCDARDYLFPLLQSWPLPSGSAETLLIRRDADTALVLNDLRFRPNAALSLRVPLARKDSPAAMAVLGQQGVVRSLDYRGVEVLAMMKGVPDSPWSMEVKLDTAEALAAWRSRSRLILLLIVGLVLLTALAALMVWQQSEKVHYRARFEAETIRRQNEERHLAEKDVLLKEIHHRVKNNLQVVASLLNLQAARTRQPEAVAALQDTRNRVHSMALLHQVLYRSPSLARISFPVYVQELCVHLLRAHGAAAGRVTLRQQVMHVSLALEHAVPCGLIINELVSNALKHGVVKGRGACITIDLQPTGDGQFVLRVRDDGAGLPLDLDPATTGTLGLQLVTSLAGQLGGKLVIERPATGGAALAVVFPVPVEAVIEEEA